MPEFDRRAAPLLEGNPASPEFLLKYPPKGVLLRAGLETTM
jgi:hypothetical protein